MLLLLADGLSTAQHLDPERMYISTEVHQGVTVTSAGSGPSSIWEFLHHTGRVHWSIPDPAAADGTDDDSYPAFERAAADIDTRIRHPLPLLTAAADERTSRDRT